MKPVIEASPENLNLFSVNARRTGLVMIVIGLVGIILPNLLSLTLNAFIGGIFLVSAIALAYIAWNSRPGSFSMWLKPFVLFALALLILFHPLVVLSVLGLLLALYFLFDGFASFTLAMEVRPSSGWGLMLFSSILSLAMSVLVLSSWPLGAVWIIGLLIGISFLFYGMALFFVARNMKAVDGV